VSRPLKYLNYENEHIRVTGTAGFKKGVRYYGYECKKCGGVGETHSGNIPTLQSCGCAKKEAIGTHKLGYMNFENDYAKVIDHEGLGGRYILQCKQCQCVFRLAGENFKYLRNRGCGCTPPNLETTSDRDIVINSSWALYVGNARRNGVAFALTKEEFARLIFGRCFYCGTEPKTASYRYNKKLAGFRNGIDRIIGAEGYVTGNCVTACYDCNVAKSDRTQAEFFAWLKRAYEHTRGGAM